MPESPEVKTIVDQLNNKLCNTGYRLENIEIKGGRFLTRPESSIAWFNSFYKRNFDFGNFHFTHKTFLPEKPKFIRVCCKGKFIYWIFEDTECRIHPLMSNVCSLGVKSCQTDHEFIKPTRWYLASTLGMTGQWAFEPSDHCGLALHFSVDLDPWGASKFQDLSIFFNDIRHFGTVKMLNWQDLEKKLKELGPDMLNDPPGQAQFNKILKKNKSLAEILMNQKYLSGVGNYIKAEALYRAQLSPHRLGNSLNDQELTQLYESIIFIMTESYRMQGASLITYKTATGENGGFAQFLQVYGKKIDPLGNPVIREETKDGRTTHWVPNVQM